MTSKKVGTAERYFDTVRRRGYCKDCGAFKPFSEFRNTYCRKCRLKRKNKGKYLTIKD